MAAGGQPRVFWRGNASFTSRASLQPHYFCKSKNILLPVCGRIIRKEVVIEIVKKKKQCSRQTVWNPDWGVVRFEGRDWNPALSFVSFCTSVWAKVELSKGDLQKVEFVWSFRCHYHDPFGVWRSSVRWSRSRSNSVQMMHSESHWCFRAESWPVRCGWP